MSVKTTYDDFFTVYVWSEKSKNAPYVVFTDIHGVSMKRFYDYEELIEYLRKLVEEKEIEMKI